MMDSKVLRVLVGGMLVVLFNIPLTADLASAADPHKDAKDQKVQNKGTGVKGKGANDQSKGTALERLPCVVPDGTNVANAEQDAKLTSRLITGEIVRIDGQTYLVKEDSGKEVRFQTTERTEVTPVNQGDRISAAINNQSEASWIRANRGTDRRTEHASADCNPN